MAEDYSTRTPGQIMRAAREQREQSLHDAHEGTKIPVNLLEAIERDEYHKLSGPLYVKSFLRNYAGWLGLDAEEILGVYELATGRPEPAVSAGDEEVWSEDQVAVTRVGMPWGRLAAIAVGATVVLVVLVVLALRVIGGDDDEAPIEPVSTAAATDEPVADDEPTNEPKAAAPAQTTAAVPAATGVEPELQPADREETAAERLARLTRHEFGATLPVEAAPPAAEVPTDAPEGRAATDDLAPPRRGDPEMRFAGGEVFPLVLRVLLPEPANCEVRRDDQPDAVPVIWPDRPGPPPAYNLRHGVAYAVRGGYAIYWGAGDHFTVTLERVRDVEVSLNGHLQSLRDWRPGQTKLLDRSMLPGGG